MNDVLNVVYIHIMHFLHHVLSFHYFYMQTSYSIPLMVLLRQHPHDSARMTELLQRHFQGVSMMVFLATNGAFLMAMVMKSMEWLLFV